MSKITRILYITLLLFGILSYSTDAFAQLRSADGTRIDGYGNRGESSRDSTKKEKIPIGIYAWKVEPRFGTIMPSPLDTLPHLFPNDAFTEGRDGRYNTTGNLGAPRYSRIHTDNATAGFTPAFIFARPYDFFVTAPEQLLYTNTKSPFTNITYHECGNKDNGEDRIRGIFSTNVNRRTGLGFKLDYLYGRGYYASQNTAHFNGTLFASYRGERYELHAHYSANHLKNSENGGVESDEYLTRPEIFPTKYGPADMPTRLTKTWNKLNANRLYLNHKYNFGFIRYRDKEGNIVKADSATGGKALSSLVNVQKEIHEPADSFATKGEESDSIELESEYVPVAGLIHTLRVENNDRRFLSNISTNPTSPGFFENFYLPGDSAADLTRHLHVDNLFAIELREGFNRWAKAGLRIFARHEFDRFTLPSLQTGRDYYTENRFSVGAQIKKENGRALRYSVLGEMRGGSGGWGEFNVEGNARLALPFMGDTLALFLNGFAKSEEPNFYFKHYHGRNAWWDNSLDKEIRLRAAATLSYRRTRLGFAIESVQNMAYLEESQIPYYNEDGIQLTRYGVTTKQTGKNLQVISLSLGHDIQLGILHWDNELTYQLSSNKDLLPLPTFNAYSNLYLLFRLAKVLRTEIGVDGRFFTEYYAHTYSPLIGNFCLQDPTLRVKTGNYPILNAYANFHLKNTRFYVMASHINSKSGSGRPFLLAHYPINGLVLRLGVSWNFFN